ncbi:hypothetical protein ACWELO_28615 [Streptomyces sp. NPDC004596]
MVFGAQCLADNAVGETDVPPWIVGWAAMFFSPQADFCLTEQKF